MVEEIRSALLEIFPSADFEVRMSGTSEVRVSWWEGALELEEVAICVARVSGFELKETSEVTFGEYGIERIHRINTFGSRQPATVESSGPRHRR